MAQKRQSAKSSRGTRKDLTPSEEILARLAARGNREEIVRTILERACEEVGAEAGSLLLRETQGKSQILRFVSVLGPAASQLREMTLPLHTGLVGHSVNKNEIVVVPDVSKDTRFASDVAKKIRYPTRNLISIPINGPKGKKALGAVELVNWKGRTPTESRVESLRVWADLLGKVTRM